MSHEKSLQMKNKKNSQTDYAPNHFFIIFLDASFKTIFTQNYDASDLMHSLFITSDHSAKIIIGFKFLLYKLFKRWGI